MLTLSERKGVPPGFGTDRINCHATPQRFDASSEEATEPNDPETPLDEAAQSERDYVRQRLREELKREPTEDELDEWLRQHTEGY
jgi:hypothetical protein